MFVAVLVPVRSVATGAPRRVTRVSAYPGAGTTQNLAGHAGDVQQIAEVDELMGSSPRWVWNWWLPLLLGVFLAFVRMLSETQLSHQFAPFASSSVLRTSARTVFSREGRRCK
jgi:hypothetical protein